MDAGRPVEVLSGMQDNLPRMVSALFMVCNRLDT